MYVRKIILADDDAEDRFILQDAMEALHETNMLLFANNGEEAWQVLKKNFNQDCSPCLIILDLNMPKLNGVQTLERIKLDERFNKIPVIIYSTSINPLEKEKCLRLGAHSYVIKPISLNESMETARMFLAFCAAGRV
jgi:CheY-like chemotaxis protein